MDRLHDKLILDAWLQEHKGITARVGARVATKWEEAVRWSDIDRQFILPNSSAVIIMKDGSWQHRSHLGKTVKRGRDLRSLIPYLDSLGMPKAEKPLFL